LVGAALVAVGMAWGPAAKADEGAPAKDGESARSAARSTPKAAAHADATAKGAKKKKAGKKKPALAKKPGAEAPVAADPTPPVDASVTLTSADVGAKAPAVQVASSQTPDVKAKQKVAVNAETKKEKEEAKAEEKKDEKAEEPIFDVGGDFVMGAARTNVVTGVVPPATTAGLNGVTNTGTASITDYSLLVSAGMKIQPCLGLGMRLPLEGGTLFANPTRQTGGVGNFELSVWGLHTLTDLIKIELSLAITLPTSGGYKVPTSPAGVAVEQSAIDQSGYDRYSVQRAISMSRGYEDDELFQPNELGINPKVGVRVGTEGKWNVTPWVKLDNLIATNKSYSGIEELVFGLNASVFVIPELEPTVRIWVNAPLSGAD
jgi:hypothetical protein